jgi:hypothetical protein
MSSIVSQGLIVLGLVVQAFSVIYSGWNYHLSIEEQKQKEGERIGKPISDQIKDSRRDWLIMTSLLFIGLVLQGIAEFVR